jgi:hypothetical protein
MLLCWWHAYLVQCLIVNARAKYSDGHRPALRLQLARAALQQRSPVARYEVHLVHKKEHRRFGRVSLQRVKTVAVVRRVLDSIVRADLENVNQHTDVLEDGRALRREVRVHKGVLAAAVPEVENEVSEEADVILFDVDGRAEARGERSGVVRAVQIKIARFNDAGLLLTTTSIQGAGGRTR